MRSRAALVLALSLGWGSRGAAELVDRIVAIVDREVITLSEAEEARRMAELQTGAEAPSLVETVDELIKARLVEREVERFGAEPVPEDLVLEARARLRASFPSAAAYDDALVRRSLSDEALLDLLRRQLAITRYLESRFRALTFVTDEEVERYYREELLPELPEGAAAVLGEHDDAIRSLLEERKFNDRVEEWIQELEDRARIRRYVW